MHSKMLWEKHFPFLVKSWLIMSVVEFRAAYQRKRAVTRAAFLTFLTFENAFESENCRKRQKIPTSKSSPVCSSAAGGGGGATTGGGAVGTDSPLIVTAGHEKIEKRSQIRPYTTAAERNASQHTSENSV